MSKHSSFEDWQRTVQGQNCAPDRDTINKMMKAWESDRTHLKNELDSTKLTFNDILNYGWDKLYPGKTDWEYPGQVINHLWSEIEIQRKKVSELMRITRELMLAGNFLYGTVCDMHGADWEMTKTWKLLASKVAELLENKGKLLEPCFTAIDLASHGDVTVRVEFHKKPDGSIVVDKVEEI
ncbi:MAG: hypothetical protein WC554_05050 [Clostridia bacterium]